MADAATERKVHGIITGLDGPVVTVSPMNVGGHHTASGRVDPQRTRLVMDGRPARLGELQLTQDARGELGLDDVWMTLQVSTRK